MHIIQILALTSVLTMAAFGQTYSDIFPDIFPRSLIGYDVGKPVRDADWLFGNQSSFRSDTFYLSGPDTEFHLPLEDLMDFDSTDMFGGVKAGEDVWDWRLLKLTKNLSVGPMVVSTYPLSIAGIEKDQFFIGGGFIFSFR